MNIFPFISDKIGRKYCMLSYWLIIAIGTAMETAATNWKIWVSSESTTI